MLSQHLKDNNNNLFRILAGYIFAEMNLMGKLQHCASSYAGRFG